MIPGLCASVEARILSLTTPQITDVSLAALAELDILLLTGRDAESHALGVHLLDGPDLLVAVTDPGRKVGDVRIRSAGAGNVLFIDNRAWSGTLQATVRFLGSDCAIVINDIGPGAFVALPDVFLRSHRQFLLWGAGATAVGCSIEIEGDEQGAIVGDDALISNGVWIRNHNMHALYDLESDTLIGREPVTTVLERHVWLGQDALLLNCPRIGAGTVIGARALVNAPIPPCVAAAGTPARVVRRNVSWGRGTYSMSEAERQSLGFVTPAIK